MNWEEVITPPVAGNSAINWMIQKRLMFLHDILRCDQTGLISKVFWAQERKPVCNDWVLQIKKDLQSVGLEYLSFENIKSQHNLSEKEVKLLMRRELKVGSYKAWRKRINQMGARREFYK